MKTYRVSSVLKILALTALMVGLPPAAHRLLLRSTRVAPLLQVGPQAIQAGVVGANYGLFTCQIVGLSPNATCYDPYQMRHAYGIDKLIQSGFDGRGKTIVIVDAFQSPTQNPCCAKPSRNTPCVIS